MGNCPWKGINLMFYHDEEIAPRYVWKLLVNAHGGGDGGDGGGAGDGGASTDGTGGFTGDGTGGLTGPGDVAGGPAQSGDPNTGDPGPGPTGDAGAMGAATADPNDPFGSNPGNLGFGILGGPNPTNPGDPAFSGTMQGQGGFLQGGTGPFDAGAFEGIGQSNTLGGANAVVGSDFADLGSSNPGSNPGFGTAFNGGNNNTGLTDAQTSGIFGDPGTNPGSNSPTGAPTGAPTGGGGGGGTLGGGPTGGPTGGSPNTGGNDTSPGAGQTTGGDDNRLTGGLGDNTGINSGWQPNRSPGFGWQPDSYPNTTATGWQPNVSPNSGGAASNGGLNSLNPQWTNGLMPFGQDAQNSQLLQALRSPFTSGGFNMGTGGAAGTAGAANLAAISGVPIK